ncbi:MAG: superoxide dismutase family protein [Gemmatimonadales bacterium]|nr:superoxide dismutase family protein [Gemmatimonadales bacterium]
MTPGATILLALAACGRGGTPGPEGEPLPDPAATAEIRNAAGERIGLATFTTADTGASLAISVSGLTPGRHGIHVHQNGDCTARDFSGAGEHFNPTARKHGLDNSDGPHAGDMPNLTVESDGSADTTLPISADLLRPVAPSIGGARSMALVIHADPDDQLTDPSGNSGDRVACGVIEG